MEESKAIYRHKSDTTINVRVSTDWRDLIDTAANALGKTRTDFIIESARRDALDVLLDRRFFSLDDAQYKAFSDALDNPPPPNEKLKHLMASKAPWEK
jgi:uncharacterized protein (DUF1778 family)